MLVYRRTGGRLEVLLVHPGGPFWTKRDAGAWSIPKGEIEPGEQPIDVAKREFREELGSSPPPEAPVPLGTIRQGGGKLVHAWALQGDFDESRLDSATFSMEWPPRSGRRQEFPEVDRAAWFSLEDARRMILPAQATFLDRLEKEMEGG